MATTLSPSSIVWKRGAESGRHFTASLALCRWLPALGALRGRWEFMVSRPLDQSSRGRRVFFFHFNGTQEFSPAHPSKQPHIFLKFAPFFSRLVSYGEGEARKCPINHLSVLTQWKGRKCREQSPYLFRFAYNKSYQGPLKGSPSDSNINSSRPRELFLGTRPNAGRPAWDAGGL